MPRRTLVALAVLLVAAGWVGPASAADDGGEAPVGLVWSTGESVRTPAIITPGATPADQRVVYGITDLSGARVVVRTLEKPGDVVPALSSGTVVDDLGTDAGAFGTDGAIGPVAGPIPWVYAVHNDNGRVEIARIDAITGSGDALREEDEYTLEGSAGCRVDATPAYAASALVFTTTGAGCDAVWRVPIDSAGRLGAAERVALPGVVVTAPPAVAGSRVVVVTSSALRSFDPGAPLTAAETGAQPRAGESWRGVAAAGGALHAVAGAGGGARLHALPGEAAAADVVAGAPGPAPAAGGRAFTTSAGAFAVQSDRLDAKRVDVPGTFGRTIAAVSGDLAYLIADGGEQAVVRLPSGSPLARADFAAPAAPGPAFGAPAIDRGYVVMAGAGGVFVYRNRDVTAPQVALEDVSGGTVRARASDARGVAKVEFRLARGGRVPRVVATDETPDAGSPFAADGAVFTGSLRDVKDGAYAADAVAIDPTGNRVTSGRITVRVGSGGLRGGRCANALNGSRRADVLRGSRRGDRIRGRGGRDRLFGGAGRDCLDGGKGRDRIRCGKGRDRVIADRRDRVAKDCERVRRRR